MILRSFLVSVIGVRLRRFADEREDDEDVLVVEDFSLERLDPRPLLFERVLVRLSSFPLWLLRCERCGRWERERERFAAVPLRGERERLPRRLETGDLEGDLRLLLRWRRSFERDRFDRFDLERERLLRDSGRFWMDLDRFDLDLDRLVLDLDRLRDEWDLERLRTGDNRFVLDGDRFFERLPERRERPFERDRFLSRDFERFEPRDLERFDRERERRRGVRERDDLRRLDTDLSLDDNIPITGSIAAEIILWASFTIDMASSISRWAASLLFASGLAIAWTEW